MGIALTRQFHPKNCLLLIRRNFVGTDVPKKQTYKNDNKNSNTRSSSKNDNAPPSVFIFISIRERLVLRVNYNKNIIPPSTIPY